MDKHYHILTAVLVLALASLACGFNLNLPTTHFNTGPTQTTDIQIPLPEDASSGVEMTLDFVGGEMKLAPGAAGSLVTGKATFNVAEFKPRVDASGSEFTVSEPDVKMEGIPTFSGDVKNEWDLQLGGAPMSLNIKAGAYKATFELGGLSLEKLAISDGAAEVAGAFSEPNKVEMSTFSYSTGTSKVELKGLANANFKQMTFSSGAGDYTLGFDGELKRDASVTIDSGIGTMTIIVPEGVNAQVTFEGGASTVKMESPWQKDGSLYKLAGSGPTLSFTVKMGAGTLNLKTR